MVQEFTQPIKKHVPLSASRIKTFETCSWLYHVKYVLKLPDKSNKGAKQGDVCHRFFEVIINPKHQERLEKIKKAKTITSDKASLRYVTYWMKKNEIYDAVTLAFIDQMIMVGLYSDFIPKGFKVIKPELDFEINNKHPKYLIKGFIDKPCANYEKNLVYIDDFKSSKKKFEGEDSETNVQAMMYSLAAKKLWPELKSKVRFIFLQFAQAPMQEMSFDDETLNGFEYYLEYIQEKLDNFTIQDATSRFSYDQPMKKGFSGRLVCGASSPDEKKKDGTPKWHCQYRFSFPYWALRKDDDTIIKTSFQNDLVPTAGQKVTEEFYEGCPRFFKVEDF